MANLYGSNTFGTTPKHPRFSFDDVLLVPRYSEIPSRKDVEASVVFPLNSGLENYVFDHPFIPANMDTVSGLEMASFIMKSGGLGILHRFMSKEESIKAVTKLKLIHTGMFAVSVGVSDSEYERAKACYDAGSSWFCVDTAHGDAKYMYDFVEKLKKSLPACKIIAGNVVTPDAIHRMKNAGVNMAKVGIGGGSICLSRVVAGHGFPQLSAIQECASVGLPIIADGGIRDPGDAVKALAFGASMVMLGSAFAGCTETPGEVSMVNGAYSKVYRGMASKEAHIDHFGGISDWKTAEGVSTTVPFKGEASGVLKHYIGGLNSGLSYSGCRTIKELHDWSEYVFVSPSVVHENRPHIFNRS